MTFVDARLRPAVAKVRPHALLLLPLAAMVFGIIVALRAQPEVFADDAAITARYAERLATGHGWTYNDGDRTNGASAPLYTTVVVLLRGLGIDTIDAMRHLATSTFEASILGRPTWPIATPPRPEPSRSPFTPATTSPPRTATASAWRPRWPRGSPSSRSVWWAAPSPVGRIGLLAATLRSPRRTAA